MTTVIYNFDGRGRKHIPRRKKILTLVSVALLLWCTIGATLAWLSDWTGPVENVFLPSQVSCEVTESFDGTTKKDVNVTNTSDIEAYLRVKLVAYRVNEQGQHIGGTAEIPSFTPGKNWVRSGEYYYYTLPVASGQKPAVALINSIDLTGSYNDADGGKQVIEVMAEAIQSGPAKAVGGAWGVTISEGSVVPYTA
jgi:hypothetical protein